MSDKKTKKKSKKCNSDMPKISNKGYYFIIIFCVVICVASITFEILNSCFNWGLNSKDCSNTIGVLCQVVSAIACCAISVFCIAISLQNNECFGIKVKKLYAMRVEKYFSVRISATAAFVLMCVNVILFLCAKYISCIGVSIILMSFCIYYIYTEIPYMIIDEKTMEKIIRNRLVKELRNDDPLKVDFDSALKYQLKDKNVKVIYEKFSDDRYPKYNKRILIKLLDVLTEEAADIDTINNEKDLKISFNSVLQSAMDILRWNFDISEVLEDRLNDCKYYLGRVLYLLLSNEKTKSETAKEIAELIVHYYEREETLSSKDKLTIKIILAIVASKTSSNDFTLLEAIKKEYSLTYLRLSSHSFSTTVFALISMYLYYLSECEIDTPDTVKDSIKKLISISGIDDNTRIISWKDLFHRFVSSYALDYKEFINLFNENSNNLTFMLNSGFMHSIVLTNEFATDWYISNLFASHRAYYYDYKTNLIENNCYYLERLKEECYIDNTFKPSDRMNNIIEFYGNHSTFSAFVVWENRTHSFKNYLDILKLEDLENEIKQASMVKNIDLEKKYRAQIEDKLKNEWAFSNEVDVHNEPSKYLSILIEKNPISVNYYDVLVDSILRSIYTEMETRIKKEPWIKIIKNESFDEQLDELLSKQIKYITDDAVYYDYLIKNDDHKKQYQTLVANVEKIQSSIFFGPTFILKDGFSFNCSIITLTANDLNGNELGKAVDEYKRPDGQYVYKSLFMSREDVSRSIYNEYALLKLEIKYNIKAYLESIIQIDIN